MPLVHLGSLPRRVKKGDILALLDQVGGLEARRVGRIDIQGDRAAIDVPEGWESRLARALDGQLLGQRRVRAWADASSDHGHGADDHFARLTRLLEVESKAQAREATERGRRLSPAEAEKSGESLFDLVIVDEDAGLGGRFLLRLAKRKRSPLPWTRLDVGSPVVLSPSEGKSSLALRGVVCDRDEHRLQVALGSMPDDIDEEQTWQLHLSTDEIATDRQRAALNQARAARGDRLAQLRDVLLGLREPEFHPEEKDGSEGEAGDDQLRMPTKTWAWHPPLDSSLNESQLSAIRFAMSSRDVALIHGPPGTGKTTTVAELIRQTVHRGQKVLACAPSNMGVDNLFARLLSRGVRAVRLGHPGRVMPGLRAHTLDLLVDAHPDVRLARKLVKEAMGLFRQASRYTRARPQPGERKATREEARSLLSDARRLEAQAVEHILDTADVLCATTTSLDSSVLGTRRFDLAVIDEACQSTEPGCWIPLLRCERAVLAGDHCQLPPTVISTAAAAEGFGRSLFERLADEHGPRLSRKLIHQYRMNQAIMDFSAREFYESELIADPSVRDHLLSGLSGVEALPLTQAAAEFIDTAGASFDEQLEPDGESRLNVQEAALVVRKVQELRQAGVPDTSIAVITPYAAQVRLLREQLSLEDGLEIDSVDGFQGREKEAVVISLVRSNAQGQIGFLSDVRRMNVAMTRARRKLLVIGDSATLAGDPFYRRLIEYFESLGAYRTVWEEGLQ